MDGDEVGNQHRPQGGFPVRAQLFGILHHRQAGGEALVAAAGDNHHRQAAAVHPGVGAGGGHGFGPDFHVVPIGGQQHLADVGAVVPSQALLGDGGVVPHLAAHGVLHVRKGRLSGKLQDALHRQHRLIRQPLLRGGLGLHLFQHLAVSLHPHNVGVVVDNAHQSAVLPGPGADGDVKDKGGIRQLHGDGGVRQVLPDGVLLPLPYGGEHLQLQGRVPGGHAGSRRRGDAPQPAGVGDEHAFHVFDDVPAGLHLHALGRAAQGLAGHGGGVGNGDGLGAAHGGHQLLVEDVYIISIGCGVHWVAPFSKKR